LGFDVSDRRRGTQFHSTKGEWKGDEKRIKIEGRA